MNEELQKRLLEYLISLESTIKASGDFVVEQAPEVVRELVLLGMVQHGVGVLLCTVIMISIVHMSVKYFPLMKKYDMTPLLMIAAFFFFVAFVIACYDMGAFLKAWLAPRIYVLEFIKGMIR